MEPIIERIRIHDIEYVVEVGRRIPLYTEALFEIEVSGKVHYEKGKFSDFFEKNIKNVYYILEENNLASNGI